MVLRKEEGTRVHRFFLPSCPLWGGKIADRAETGVEQVSVCLSQAGCRSQPMQAKQLAVEESGLSSVPEKQGCGVEGRGGRRNGGPPPSDSVW